MTKPDFWSSMTAAQAIPADARNTPDWAILERAYSRWNLETQISGKIPRIVHQIWLGSPLPSLYAGWGQTWRSLNPGWDYRLWTEREIDSFGLVNRRAYDESPSFGVKSDLARYEILERLGGVYADTDFECLVPFGVLADSTDFFAGLMYGSQPVIANGLIGCGPGHPIMQRIVADLSQPFFNTDGMAILHHSGPARFTKECLSHLRRDPESAAVILPTTYLYPFPNRNIAFKDLQLAREWIKPESLAIHYWEVSWRKQTWTSRLFSWMKKNLPDGLVRAMYKAIKGSKEA